MDNSNLISITPFTETTTRTITQFKIRVSDVVLFTSVSLNVECYDADNNFVCVKNVVLENLEYLAWGNNDTYLIETVKTKLGFT